MIEFPSIIEFLNFFDFLRGNPAAYLVMVTAALILIVRDWRWSLLFLTAQYLVVGLLFADVLLPHLAFMKVLVGMFVCLILYITARQVNWGKLPEDVTPDEAVQLQKERFVRFGSLVLPTDTPLRVFLALIICLAVWATAQRSLYLLPAAPDHFHVAVFALIGLGLVTLSLTDEPLMAGLGLLTFLTGFELFYSALEQSVAMLGLLGAVNLAIALTIAYLTQARHAYRALLD
ncbi:MAG TPA: hypothetical protein VLE70_10765 [Anaerolineae bacterium]|jgi:uncharacterized membrane protein|nr:hypothetical protein [Anaerolineae bacterium]